MMWQQALIVLKVKTIFSTILGVFDFTNQFWDLKWICKTFFLLVTKTNSDDFTPIAEN